ncbi:MAG: hypothetical protein WBZ29_13905 [Methanocella sp.]
MQPGVIGPGKMGSDLALQAVDRGIYVAGHSKHGHPFGKDEKIAKERKAAG